MSDFTHQKLRSFCNACGREQNQVILAQHEENYRDDEQGYWGESVFQVVRCGGCDTISFRDVSMNSEDRDYHTGELEISVKCFPESQANLRNIKPFLNVPQKIRAVYREVIDGFNHRTLLLCAGGIRAVIEAICQAENIVDGPVQAAAKGGGTQTIRASNLKGKIEGMFEKGIISNDYKAVLHDHRVFGNEALHEVEQPEMEEVSLAIDIIEHSLEHLYEIPRKAAMFKAIKTGRKQVAPATTPIPPPAVSAAIPPSAPNSTAAVVPPPSPSPAATQPSQTT